MDYHTIVTNDSKRPMCSLLVLLNGNILRITVQYHEEDFDGKSRGRASPFHSCLLPTIAPALDQATTEVSSQEEVKLDALVLHLPLHGDLPMGRGNALLLLPVGSHFWPRSERTWVSYPW